MHCSDFRNLCLFVYHTHEYFPSAFYFVFFSTTSLVNHIFFKYFFFNFPYWEIPGSRIYRKICARYSIRHAFIGKTPKRHLAPTTTTSASKKNNNITCVFTLIPRKKSNRRLKIQPSIERRPPRQQNKAARSRSFIYHPIRDSLSPNRSHNPLSPSPLLITSTIRSFFPLRHCHEVLSSSLLNAPSARIPQRYLY